jgi:phosphatidylglycerophosphate synthase
MLTAYVRALGGALGTPQFFIGPQSKSQRMAVLPVAAVAAALLPTREMAAWLVLLALVVVLIGSLVTVVRRLLRIAAELNTRGA